MNSDVIGSQRTMKTLISKNWASLVSLIAATRASAVWSNSICASLNYQSCSSRHLRPVPFPAVPLSDAAGEVIAVGENVTRWKVVERVCPIFMQGWLEGAVTPQKARTALGGGDLDGVLREFGAFDENGLVRVPDHLSYEEAAALPCAGVTAWHALVEFGNLKAGETVLTLGTGGVSTFAVQLAKLHGARVIATSSSDEGAVCVGCRETISTETLIRIRRFSSSRRITWSKWGEPGRCRSR
jgi:NADPH:quinone reductase-like Zn-dependent oxidoreductase